MAARETRSLPFVTQKAKRAISQKKAMSSSKSNQFTDFYCNNFVNALISHFLKGGALHDIQKMAARETSKDRNLKIN